MDYVLAIKRFSKSCGRIQALAGVDTRVPAGGIYRLAGKDGSGKTALMRLVTGLESPSDGSFTLYGAGLREERKKPGAVIETPAVYPSRNVRDSLADAMPPALRLRPVPLPLWRPMP
jgi:ABC-2 type transport system ATP-binding protein